MQLHNQTLQKAIDEHKKGDFTAAELLYKDVLASDPQNTDALHYLGLICIEYGRYDIARDLITRAKIAKKDANLSYNLGLCEQHLGHTDAATALYHEAIQINPGFALAHNNLGVMLQQQGLHEEARNHFTLAIESNPHFTEAHYNFAYNEKFTTFPDIGHKMLAQTQLENTPDNEKRKLHFALGKIFDDIGEYDNAFHNYAQGNKLKDAFFNLQSFTHYTDNVMDFFKQHPLDLAFKNTYFRKAPVFILGMPRSGTTLTEQIIAAHPEVTAGGEMGFIGDIIDRIPDVIDNDCYYPACLEDITQQQLDNLLADAFLNISRKHPFFEIITDKTPINFLHIGLIKTLFPDAKIIHCVRDPIDTCLSCYFQDFNMQHSYSYDLQHLGSFYINQHKLMQYWKLRYPDIYTVSYESLVADPEHQTRQLIAHCGLAWSDACLAPHNAKREINTASNWQARQPIYKTSVKRWQHYDKYLGELKDLLKDYMN